MKTTQKNTIINKLIGEGYKKLSNTRNIFFNGNNKICYVFKSEIVISNKNEHNCLNLKIDDFHFLKDYKVILYVETKSNMNQKNSIFKMYEGKFTKKISVRSYYFNNIPYYYRCYLKTMLLNSIEIISTPRNIIDYNPKIHLVA